MKIFYISQFFIPERVAASFRAYDNSKAWISMGDEVTVFTAYPNFPTGKLFEGYKIKMISEEFVDGIRVIRSKIFIKNNINKVNKVINAISFLFFGVINFIFNNNTIDNDYDIVIGTSGTILSPILAYIYACKKKIPFILELRDLTYLQMLAVYKEKTILYKLVKKIELFLCKKAKSIVVVTNGFKDELINCGICKEKINVIFNGINTKEIQKSLANKDKKKIIISYIGNLGKSQNLIEVIDMFESLKICNYMKELYIIGDGANKLEIKKYIKKNKYTNIKILDGMSQKEVERYYDFSDFCIVSLTNNNFFKYTVPSKIFQIMGRGKCIIFFGPNGEASEIINKVESNFIYTNPNFDIVLGEFEKDLNKFGDLKKYLAFKSNIYRNFIIKNYDRNKLAYEYRKIILKCKN